MSKADRYISKGGRTLGYGRDEFAADLHTAVTFMCWAQDDGAYYAGHTAQEAFKAMCRMLDIDSVALRKIAMDRATRRASAPDASPAVMDRRILCAN